VRVAITLALACDVPLLVYPALEMLFPMLLRQKVNDVSFKVKATAASCMLFSAAGLAALADESFGLVLGVVGTLSCVYVSVVLPCGLYLRAHHPSDPRWLLQASWLVLVLMVGLCLFSFVVVVQFSYS